MRSLISLCLRIGKPPRGQDRACSTEKDVPHSQLDGVLLGGQPYLRAIASRKSPLCKANPNSLIGSVVSQLEAKKNQRCQLMRPGAQ